MIPRETSDDEPMKKQATRQPSAILLDLDGTLIDTYHLYLEAYRRALAPYLGHPPSDAEFIARRPSSEKRFLAGWIGETSVDACHAAMARHYEALHPSLCEGMYEGVPEMLAALRSAGIPLGLVTGKGRRAWEVTERALDLGRFEVVVTDDEMEEPKPHPGGLVLGLASLGVEADKTVYIGDSVSDLAAGRAAGMLVGAALWPKTSAEDRESFLREIEVHEPDWTFERPADVTRLFASWC
jgi:pyrophosphatase PpaX